MSRRHFLEKKARLLQVGKRQNLDKNLEKGPKDRENKLIQINQKQKFGIMNYKVCDIKHNTALREEL